MTNSIHLKGKVPLISELNYRTRKASFLLDSQIDRKLRHYRTNPNRKGKERISASRLSLFCIGKKPFPETDNLGVSGVSYSTENGHEEARRIFLSR